MRIPRMIAALRQLHRNERGLTAIELAVVVAILAVLAGLVASNTTGMSTSARGTTKATDTSEVQKAVDNYVGQHPAAQYPVTTTTVDCSTGAASGTLSDLTITGLKAMTGTLCAQLSITATFTTPDATPVPKKFVSDFMQRNPKHVTETPNPWLIDTTGTVKNILTSDLY